MREHMGNERQHMGNEIEHMGMRENIWGMRENIWELKETYGDRNIRDFICPTWSSHQHMGFS